MLDTELSFFTAENDSFEEHLLKAFENPGDKIFSANLYKVESIKVLKIWGEKEEGEKYFWPLVKVTVENYDEEITIPFNEAILYTHFGTKIQVQDEEQVNKDMMKLNQILNSLEAIKLAITFHPEDEFPKVEITDIKLSK